jgi:drug/metabolite transporter (DMT)-like permease
MFFSVSLFRITKMDVLVLTPAFAVPQADRRAATNASTYTGNPFLNSSSSIYQAISETRTSPRTSNFLPFAESHFDKKKIMAVCMLLAAAFCWGVGNIANKTALLHLQPVMIVGLRCLLAVSVIMPFALRDIHNLRDRSFLASGLCLSAFFAAALVFQQLAYQWTSVTNASFLVSTETIITPLLGWLILGHKQLRPVLVAVPITIIGALLLAGGAGSLRNPNAGDLACLASAFFYAAWMLALGRHVMRHGKPLATAFLQCAFTAALTLPIAMALQQPSLDQVGSALPELLVLGIVSTALAHVLQIVAQRQVDASIAAILVSAESLFGATAAYYILDERLSPLGAGGACLILIAILIVAFAAQAPIVEHAPRRVSAARYDGRTA